MSWNRAFVAVLAFAGVAAGCATTSDPYYSSTTTAHPSASPHSLGPVRTDGPQIDNADAAGPASVPGTRTGVAPAVVVPPAASPVIIVPPAEPAPPTVIVPAPQPR
jgi:hypothetical protein